MINQIFNFNNKKHVFNRCDVCGQFISYSDFEKEIATRVMLTPDSELTTETYETLCRKHSKVT